MLIGIYKMILKTRITSMLFIALVMSLSMTANANNKQVVKTQLNEAQILAQKAQMEAAYIRLIKMSEKKEADKKLEEAKNNKPRLINASFSSNKLTSQKNEKKSYGRYNKRLKVTATAYTSHVDQTDSTPNIAAWGDRLKPGMKSIAVSRDLLNVYGLKHKQKVRIKGLEGEYLVLDKMNKRWRKKIDIYMGMNKKKAFRWGKRKVEILWNH